MFNNAKQNNHLNNKHKIYLLLLITIVLSIPIRLSSAQTIYKWVDDNGSVHYEGNPPMNITEFNTLRIENVPKSEAPIAPSSSEDKKIPKDEDKRIPKEKKRNKINKINQSTPQKAWITYVRYIRKN